MVGNMKNNGVDVTLSCNTLGVSRSSYYAWCIRPESHRAKEMKELADQIKTIHAASRGTYGAPRITEKIKNSGKICSTKRVAKIMKIEGLSGKARKRFKVMTTDSNHDLPIADRVFQTENPETFPTKPNQVWASDITYVATDEGWLFLAIFLDLFTRKIVGYSMADHMRTELVLNALNMALLNQNPNAGELISHSDRGSQYAAEACRKRLLLLGITASMSRKGNCYDNAYAESFFHSLKVELIHSKKFKTRKEAMSAIFEYIEVWYNRQRLHSSLGYKTPMEYEQIHLAS
jgi:transposase InsO family protein